ncbi:MAG: outer membrane receptor for ferrienterochelin and colicins [Planctomycetota bacterium]|jgi:outer membrane receptor for ferrienterochelin and colicins
MQHFNKKYITLLILSLFVFAIKAQNSLKVYDAQTLDALPYATIHLTNSNNRNFNTTTNEYGEFEIPNHFENQISIVVSYLGYQTLYKDFVVGKLRSLYIFPYEKEVDEVVVTATSRESSTKESIYKIEVINKEEIENRAANNLGDALMNNMNIEIQHSVLGSTINLQGLSGANVKVMIDGVPLIGRLNGELDLSQINMNNIERVEIVEGPLSVIYGSNALAGVINLITKKSQKEKIEGVVNGYYESVGNYNVDATIGLKIKNHFLQLGGGRYFFKGWNDGEYDRDLSWDPKEVYFADFSYVYRTKSDWFNRFKFSFFEDKMLDRKDPNGPFSIADDQWFKTRKIDAAYILNGTYKENYYLQSTNSYNNYRRIKNTYTKDLAKLSSSIKDNTDYSTFQDTTTLQQFASRTFIAYNPKEGKFNYQVGYDLSIETGKGERFQDENNTDIIMTDIAAFASFTYKPNNKFSFQPAIRYGYNSKFTTRPTLSATIKYDISKKVIYRLSYGMGFRAPSLKEMYLNFQNINHNIQGNEDLNAERSHNISTSVEYSNTIEVHHYKLKVNAFFNHKYDGIFLSQKEGTDDTEFTYVNAYKYQTLGGQIDLMYRVKRFSMNTGFSYIGTYNREKDQDEDLTEFFFKPAFKLNLNYSFKKWGLNLSLFNKLVGSAYDYNIDVNGDTKAVKLDTYDLLDFTASKTFWKKKIKLSAGVKNILNVTSINEGFSSGGTHSSSSGSEISTGRSYFVGLKYKI